MIAIQDVTWRGFPLGSPVSSLFPKEDGSIRKKHWVEMNETVIGGGNAHRLEDKVGIHREEEQTV